MTARKRTAPADPVREARLDRCACEATRISCRALTRHRGRPCCPACTHKEDQP